MICWWRYEQWRVPRMQYFCGPCCWMAASSFRIDVTLRSLSFTFICGSPTLTSLPLIFSDGSYPPTSLLTACGSSFWVRGFWLSLSSTLSSQFPFLWNIGVSSSSLWLVARWLWLLGLFRLKALTSEGRIRRGLSIQDEKLSPLCENNKLNQRTVANRGLCCCMLSYFLLSGHLLAQRCPVTGVKRFIDMRIITGHLQCSVMTPKLLASGT